jgi:hypothetical protein
LSAMEDDGEMFDSQLPRGREVHDDETVGIDGAVPPVVADPVDVAALHRRRRRERRIMLLIVVGACAAAAVGLSVGLVNRRESASSSMSSSSTSSSTTASYGDLLEAFRLHNLSQSMNEAIDRGGTPQYVAYQWLMNDSQQVLDPNSDPYVRLAQRFALASLYHATNGSTAWKSRFGWLVG